MSKQRMINTRFWSDSYIVQLEPLERYLFLYFLTNEHTDICGIYELPFEVMARETGLKSTMLEKMLTRFAGKIHWIDGWVWIKNFSKHQKTNSSVEKGIQRSLEAIPEKIKAQIEQIQTDSRETVGRLSTDCQIPKPKLKPKLKPEPKPYGSEGGAGGSLEPAAPSPSEMAIQFFSDQNKQFEITEWLVSKGISREVAQKEIQKFVDYWTEKTLSGNKQRWQTEKAFELKRRLATWFSRIREFGSKSPKITVID